MKWKLLLLLITVILVNSCGIAYADTIDELTDTVDQTLEGLDFSDIDSVAGDFIDSVYDKIQQIINGQFDSAESFWNIFCRADCLLLELSARHHRYKLSRRRYDERG